MKNLLIFLSVSCITFFICKLIENGTSKEEVNQTGQYYLIDNYNKIPLHFEPNLGQFSDDVKYGSSGKGYNLHLKSNEFVLNFNHSKEDKLSDFSAQLRIGFVDANPDPIIIGKNQLSGKSNYYIGNNPDQWQQNVPNYRNVNYKDIYPNIDLVYYGREGQLEYDFVVSPGADPSDIQLSFNGLDNISISENGKLIASNNYGEVVFKEPIIYQEIDGFLNSISGQYAFNENGNLEFKIGQYNHNEILIIDPVIEYSTYISASSVRGITLDKLGNIYLTGTNGNEAFIQKINSSCTAVLFNTIVGGSGTDRSNDIEVDDDGNCYIVGGTSSSDFAYAAGSLKGPSDAFILKLSADGSSIQFASFLGGNKNSIFGGTEEGRSIAIDQFGSSYITGDTDSKDFPITGAAIQTSHMGGDGISEAFIAIYSPGGALSYSTYLGGVGMDFGSGIALDTEGNIYVCGGTQSRDFPTTEGAYSTTYNDKIADVFVIKLNSSGSAAYFSTYIGSYFPQANAITVDEFGNSYIAGSGVFKLNPDGTQLIYRKTVNNFAQINAIEVDNLGNAYVTGSIDMIDLKTVDPTQESLSSGYCSDVAGDCPDAFVTIINADGTDFLFSTYLGGGGWDGSDEGFGIALGPNESFYVAGMTRSEEFPTKNALRTNYSGGFLVKYGKIQEVKGIIYDQVMDGGPSIFSPFTPQISNKIVKYNHFTEEDETALATQVATASKQIIQQYQFFSAEDTLTFIFEGRSPDEMVGLRINNTKKNIDQQFPLKLTAKVIDPENTTVGLFPLPNIHRDNFGAQFQVSKNGLYRIKVFLKEDSLATRYPAPFQIHLSGDVGLPRKLINDEPEVKRGTRLDILFNHPAPRPQTLAGKDSSVAQTALFKFANPVSVSNYPIAVMLPLTDNGYPVGETIIRAAEPNILGYLNPNIIDITTPTARTPEWNAPKVGSIIDFTQVPLPHSVEEWPPLPPLQGTVCSAIGENDGIEVTLPLTAIGGVVNSLILDMGSGQEIVDGEGNDFKVFSSSGNYNVSISNSPNRGTFKVIGGTVSGNQEFDFLSTGLTSGRYILINADPEVSLDAVKSINQFMDVNRSDIGPAVDAAEATIFMRRMKGPEIEFDPFLELIAPDGSKLGEDESGFVDNTSLDLSDAALIGIDLTQIGFHRFLARGYHQIPNDQSFGSYCVNLETGGIYDKEDIIVSPNDEISVITQRTGEIIKTRQRDSYKFQAEPGTKINIVVNTIDETLNPILELYDPENFLLGINDDYQGRGRNSALSLTLPELSFLGNDKLPNPSTYRIIVSGIDKAGSKTIIENIGYHLREVASGNYELKVFTGEMQGIVTPEITLQSISPNASVQGVSNFNILLNGKGFEPGLFFKFSGEGVLVNNTNVLNDSTVKINITITQSAAIGWRDVILSDINGNNITFNKVFRVVASLGSINLTWDPPIIGEQITPPTNLFAQIILGKQTTGPVGKQKNNSNFINLINRKTHNPHLLTSIPEIEPNNSFEQAQVLSGEEQITLIGNAEVDDLGSISIYDDDIEDLFQISIGGPGIEISLHEIIADCDLYLFNIDGVLLLESRLSDTDPESIIDDYLPPGIYYIGVSIYDFYPGTSTSTSYTLSVFGNIGTSLGPTLFSYNIYRSTTANAKNTGSLIGNVVAGSNSYTDPAKFVGNFFYQITGVYDIGESEPSNEASVTVTRINNDEDKNIPDEFKLFQNYPNPFNPTTTIKYLLPAKSNVTMEIYDVLGKEIKLLLNEIQVQGSYEIKFNAESLTSGIYFYRITAGDFIETKKMLFIK